MAVRKLFLSGSPNGFALTRQTLVLPDSPSGIAVRKTKPTGIMTIFLMQAPTVEMNQTDRNPNKPEIQFNIQPLMNLKYTRSTI